MNSFHQVQLLTPSLHQHKKHRVILLLIRCAFYCLCQTDHSRPVEEAWEEEDHDREAEDHHNQGVEVEDHDQEET